MFSFFFPFVFSRKIKGTYVVVPEIMDYVFLVNSLFSHLFLERRDPILRGFERAFRLSSGSQSCESTAQEGC